MPVHLLVDLTPELVAILEVELELQQVAEPGDLGPERADRVRAVDPGPEHGQLAQGRVEHEVDHRVPVEGGGQLMVGPDLPDRLAPVRGDGDESARDQHVEGRLDGLRADRARALAVLGIARCSSR